MGSPGGPDGIVVVDKPAGWTSHDVVARMRRLLGTRRVGHAGTLDPMATGVLVVGVGRATRLLGHIAGHHKAYSATIRLGWSTTTDDAQGDRLAAVGGLGAQRPSGDPIGGDVAEVVPGARADGLGMSELLPAVEALTGPILQRPSSVSAIKVAGRRSHERVRAGEVVDLPARPVLVSVFDILACRPDRDLGVLDLDVDVECSSGTYVRALARDLGALLGTGGHLTALRRTRVGGFVIEEARTLDELAIESESGPIELLGLADAAASAFPVVAVPEADADAVRHGRLIDLERVWAPFREISGAGEAWSDHVEAHAVFDHAGELLALVAPRQDASVRYLAVFASA